MDFRLFFFPKPPLPYFSIPFSSSLVTPEKLHFILCFLHVALLNYFRCGSLLYLSLPLALCVLLLRLLIQQKYELDWSFYDLVCSAYIFNRNLTPPLLFLYFYECFFFVCVVLFDYRRSNTIHRYVKPIKLLSASTKIDCLRWLNTTAHMESLHSHLSNGHPNHFPT